MVSAVEVAGAATRFKNAPLRNTLYPLMPDPPGLSIEAVHDTLNWLQLATPAITVAGGDGAMVSPAAAGVLVGRRVAVLIGVDVFVAVRVFVATGITVAVGLPMGTEHAGVLELKLYAHTDTLPALSKAETAYQ